MKRSLVLSLVLIAASAVFMLRPVFAASKPDATSGSTPASGASASSTRTASSTSSKKHHAIDPDDAYKNNCMRCHTGLPQYNPRMSKTIMLHMRQDANIPGDEADAILEYLRGNN